MIKLRMISFDIKFCAHMNICWLWSQLADNSWNIYETFIIAFNSMEAFYWLES